MILKEDLFEKYTVIDKWDLLNDLLKDVQINLDKYVESNDYSLSRLVISDYFDLIINEIDFEAEKLIYDDLFIKLNKQQETSPSKANTTTKTTSTTAGTIKEEQNGSSSSCCQNDNLFEKINEQRAEMIEELNRAKEFCLVKLEMETFDEKNLHTKSKLNETIENFKRRLEIQQKKIEEKGKLAAADDEDDDDNTTNQNGRRSFNLLESIQTMNDLLEEIKIELHETNRRLFRDRSCFYIKRFKKINDEKEASENDSKKRNSQNVSSREVRLGNVAFVDGLFLDKDETELIRNKNYNLINSKLCLAEEQQSFAWTPRLSQILIAFKSLNSMDGNKMSILKLNLLETLPNTIEFNLTLIEMNSLHPESFNSLVNLLKLDISSNKLKDIDESTFKMLNKLEKLFITETDITEIGKWIENKQMANLKILDFNYSQNLEHLKSGQFNILTNLVDLRLPFCRIKHIPANIFDSQINLVRLNLGWNDLRTIDPAAFKPLVKLEVLVLNDNKLNNLNWLNGLTSLKSLTLRNNFIETLKDDQFIESKNLEKLSLTHNRLFHIQPVNSKKFNVFNGLSKLEILRIRKNFLTEINKNTFKHLNNLRTLNLRNNDINSIHINAFKKMHNLKVLDLDANSKCSFKEKGVDFVSVPEFFKLNNKKYNFYDGNDTEMQFSDSETEYDSSDDDDNYFNYHSDDDDDDDGSFNDDDEDYNKSPNRFYHYSRYFLSYKSPKRPFKPDDPEFEFDLENLYKNG